MRIGTVMLAKKTSSATGHIPMAIISFTPERMVSGSPWPREVTVMIGSRLAGT